MTAVTPGTTHGFLFADLRDYTHFVETRGDDAAAELLRDYRDLVRQIIGDFGGAEIRTEGDSFYLVFPSASSAVLGGLAILAAANEATKADPNQPLRVAIGVHAGETADTGEGPVGSAVNIAARVCAQARAGELLVTDTVRSLTRTRLSVRFVSRGSPALKGIQEPIALFAVEPTDTGTHAPAGWSGVTRQQLASRLAAQPTSKRWFLLGVTAAAVVAIAIGTTLLLGPLSRPSSSPGSSSSPAPANLTALPVMADVPFYRADTTRSSIYPGPGPTTEPQIAWERALGGAADVVPIVTDGKVIVGDLAGDLIAFDGRSGDEAWRFPAKAGFSESAAAASGLVFAADLGGTLHGIDASTGVERWQQPLPNDGVQPVVVDGLLYAGSSDGHAYGLDPATGQKRWEWEGPAGVKMVVSVVSDGIAFIGGSGRLYAIRLVDKAEVWHRDTGSAGQSTAVLAGDTIFISGLPTPANPNGALLAIDRATGDVRWRFSSPSGLQVVPGAVRSDVVFVNTAGDGIYALRDRGSGYEVAWHDEKIPASYRPTSLVGDTLYVGIYEGPLVALRASDGIELWRTQRGSSGTSNPVVTGGLVYRVDGEAGILRAWAEPGLIALLPKPVTTPSESPAPSRPPNPFEVVATYSWAQTAIQLPADMAFGPDGLLYVLHAKLGATNPLVTVIDPTTGRPVPGRSWGRAGTGGGEFDLSNTGPGNGPGGCISVGRDGLVYVGDWNNRRIQVFRADGAFVRQFETEQRPGGCEVARDGSVFVGGESGRLFKYDKDGTLLWHVSVDPARPGIQYQLHGFTLRPDGSVIGFTDGTGQVFVLDAKDGRIVEQWGTQGSEPGQNGLSGEPSVDRAGNIYVFQYVPQQLQVFDPGGSLIGGIYEDPEFVGDQPQFTGRVFWPAPVFDSKGFGWSFGPDGLIKLKINLPTH